MIWYRSLRLVTSYLIHSCGLLNGTRMRWWSPSPLSRPFPSHIVSVAKLFRPARTSATAQIWGWRNETRKFASPESEPNPRDFDVLFVDGWTDLGPFGEIRFGSMVYGERRWESWKWRFEMYGVGWDGFVWRWGEISLDGLGIRVWLGLVKWCKWAEF